jgi:hypothetical protein
VLVGDVDGDGHADLLAGNAGTWAVGGSALAPSVWIWRSDGTGFPGSAEKLVGGGTEFAGAAPSLALADLGPVFPSRHPIDAGPASHVSTETAPFGMHVTCSDCHNSHEATATAAIAPAVSGPMKGAWGVAVTYPGGVRTLAAPARVTNGYEVCYKCHSSYDGGNPDTAAQFDPATVARHAVEIESTTTIAAATFVAPWTEDSMLQCTDCHGDSGGATAAQKRELHESASAPLLDAPYLGADPTTANALCFKCHDRAVYATGAADGVGMSSFLASGGAKLLHSLHVKAAADGGHGVSCSACHVAHGSVTLPHLLRSDIGFTGAGAHAGSCANGCHTGGAGHSWP